MVTASPEVMSSTRPGGAPQCQTAATTPFGGRRVVCHHEHEEPFAYREHGSGTRSGPRYATSSEKLLTFW